MTWRPMGQSAEISGALHEGVPVWMEKRLWAWLNLSTQQIAQYQGVYPNAVVARFDELMRLEIPLADQIGRMGVADVFEDTGDDELILTYVDYLVFSASQIDSSINSRIGDILDSSGSAWRVGTRTGFAGLERRVAQGAQEAADAVMDGTGKAGELLSEAWHATYGRQPDPTKAYSLAIKAVEEASVGIVAPNHRTATLGNVAQYLKDQHWNVPLEQDEKHPSADTLWSMARSLVAGEAGRHGGNGHRVLTQQEAETAVFLAVPLVQFFHAGLYERK